MSIRKEILTTLAYFDIFDYPLTKSEIVRFLQRPSDSKEVDPILDLLMDDMLVFKLGDFYSLHNDFDLATKRIGSNARARLMLTRADKIAGMIGAFPFVRAVAVSGSLSKNCADERSDIDFFIITAPGRLWVARSFLHLLKKLSFLLGKQHLLCMNYFIDAAYPVIREKNIYTATEVVTLLPMRGEQCFQDFFAANSWTTVFLPNNYMRISSGIAPSNNFLKRLMEWILSNRSGSRLDDFLMKLTINRWRRKAREKQRNLHGMVMGLDAGKHYAKPDPRNFQQDLLDQFAYKVTYLHAMHDNELHLTNEI